MNTGQYFGQFGEILVAGSLFILKKVDVKEKEFILFSYLLSGCLFHDKIYLIEIFFPKKLA